jgi:hypothetical protein
MKHMTRPLPVLTARAALTAAFSGLALFGCASDHALGDLPTRDLLAVSDPDAAQTAGADRSLDPLLAPPEVSLDAEREPGYGAPGASAAGDLDGDGYDDIATLGYDIGTQTEFVHVRYGGPRPADSDEAFAFAESGARLTIPTDNPNAPLLLSLESAGDIDGDGYADLLVNLIACEPSDDAEGIYLLYGGADRLSGIQRFDRVGVHLPLLQPVPQAQGGWSCSSAAPRALGVGDFDGDGFDDFVVHDPQRLEFDNAPEIGGSPDSSVYLFYGRRERLVTGTSLLSADARLTAHQDLGVTALGDVDADGDTDLIVGARTIFDEIPSGFFALSGRSERLRGDIDVASLGVSLPRWRALQSRSSLDQPDLDGDGIADLILRNGDDGLLYLFYGRPGLLEREPDVADSAALLTNDLDDLMDVLAAGDRDGDGDTDLVSTFARGTTIFSRGVALLGGSRQRFTGAVVFPYQAAVSANPDGILFEDYRFLEDVAVAGDLDGDGASDLITTSSLIYPRERENSFDHTTRQVHIHYGVPGSLPQLR